MKHIEFSQGFYFLDDLQEHLKNASYIDPADRKFDFTYNIHEELKIDVEKAKAKKMEKEQQMKREFEELKNKMQ